MAAGLALLAYIVAHTLWTTGLTARSWHAINRYHELLFAPLLFALMSDARHRLIFMRAVLASAVLLALAHWVALFVTQPRADAGEPAYFGRLRAGGLRVPGTDARTRPGAALAGAGAGRFPGPHGAAGHRRANRPRRGDRAAVVCRMAPQPATLALGGCRGKPAAGVGVRHELPT